MSSTEQQLKELDEQHLSVLRTKLQLSPDATLDTIITTVRRLLSFFTPYPPRQYAEQIAVAMAKN